MATRRTQDVAGSATVGRILGTVIADVPVGALVEHPSNPREGDLGAVIESIRANGWFGVVVAQRSTAHVLVGNHRLRAAVACGLETVRVMWLDVDDTAALRILLADNKTSDAGAYDEAALMVSLRAVLADPMGLAGTGWTAEDVEEIRAALAITAAADKPPAPLSADVRCPRCGHEQPRTPEVVHAP